MGFDRVVKGVGVKVAVGLQALILWGVFAALAQDATTAGRQIVQAHQDAVITVRLVISQQISMGTRSDEEELTQEITGTVVDPSGLTVVSLSQTDPSSFLRSMMGDAGMMDAMKMESKVVDVKLLLADGTELPAAIALRDNELDLAYIRPKQAPTTPLKFVDLRQGADAEILQPLIGLSRLGTVAGRASGASHEYVHAIVQRPRKFYVLSTTDTGTSLGAPVFDLAGKPLGIVVIRSTPPTGSGGMMGVMMSGAGDNVLPIVLPSSAIAQSLDQALQVPLADSAAPKSATPPSAEAVTPPAEAPAPAEAP